MYSHKATAQKYTGDLGAAQHVEPVVDAVRLHQRTAYFGVSLNCLADRSRGGGGQGIREPANANLLREHDRRVPAQMRMRPHQLRTHRIESEHSSRCRRML